MTSTTLAVLAASGGMDSATLAYHYHQRGHRLLLLGFDYGQRHRVELDHARRLADRLHAEHRVIDLRVLRAHLHGSALTDNSVDVPDGHYAQDTMRATVVPNRNAIMLSIATGVAVAEGAEVVATAVHAGDHFIYPDCRPAFFDPFAAAMQAANDGFSRPGFRVEAPFIHWTKAQIAEHGAGLGVDYSLTWSCYKGGDVHCGTCGTCVERYEAFRLAGVPDPTEYADTAFAPNELERVRDW